jgi:Fe-S cluster assembly protein SufD
MNAAANVIERIGGLPAARDEHWQYAPLRALRAVHDWSHAPAPAAAALTALVPAATPGFDQLVFVDGHLAGGSLAASVRTGAAPAATSPERDLRLAALPALAGLPDLLLELEGTRQVELCYVCSGAAGTVYPRLHLKIAANAAVMLVERHTGQLAAGALACSDYRLQLGAASQLRHYRLQGQGAAGLVFDQLQAQLAAAAAYTVFQIAAHRAPNRTTAQIELAGRGARCEWHCAMNLESGESSDLLLRVLHRAPATESLSRFRGIATGQSRASCAADVVVDSSARGARVQQSLKGLNDGTGAGVNLRPRLTIDTDDIQAQHGATTGQLDAQLLFYLRSRGLDVAAATRLLKWAFLGDVLAGIRDPQLRRAAEALAGRGLAP